MAPRYAEARPDVHSAVVEHLRGRLAPHGPLRNALDVGCGTGLSTRPLGAITRRAIGLDLSPAMLQEAARRRGAVYLRGRAETLPFADASIDLVTIGCAYHWCETDALLAETRRILAPAGHLALYDNFFLADTPRSTVLHDWLQAEHWSRLPVAARNALPGKGRFDEPGFELVEDVFLDDWVPMSREMLVRYLTTQSGVVAAVESGQRTLSEIESFLRDGLAERYPEEGGSMHFGGPLWIARRDGAGAVHRGRRVG